MWTLQAASKTSHSSAVARVYRIRTLNRIIALCATQAALFRRYMKNATPTQNNFVDMYISLASIPIDLIYSVSFEMNAFRCYCWVLQNWIGNKRQLTVYGFIHQILIELFNWFCGSYYEIDSKTKKAHFCVSFRRQFSCFDWNTGALITCLFKIR